MNYQENKKSMRMLIVLILVQGLLVATHLGEFWPFSIYPMFSQAGKPWTRALAREMPADYTIVWETVPVNQVPGTVFSFEEVGINTNDVANYIQKAGTWDKNKLNGIRALFGGKAEYSNIMLFRVQGRLVQNDSVSVLAQPIIYMTSETTMINPALESNYHGVYSAQFIREK